LEKGPIDERKTKNLFNVISESHSLKISQSHHDSLCFTFEREKKYKLIVMPKIYFLIAFSFVLLFIHNEQAY